jgi:hypothetical protein
MLVLTKKGVIVSISSFDSSFINLEDHDIKNSLFEGFQIEEGFTFRSFFSMLSRYPTLSQFFQIAQSYIEEFNSLDVPQQEINKIAVLTPVNTVHLNMLTSHNKLEVFSYGEFNNILTEDISSMYMKEYIDYHLNVNSCTQFDNISEENAVTSTYLEYQPEAFFDLLTFVRIIIDNVSLHGFAEERNQVIEEIEHELQEHQQELENDAKVITDNIFDDIRRGNPQ